MIIMLSLFFLLACETEERAPIVGNDGVVFRYIPAGRYQVGSSSDNAPLDEQPSFWAKTEGFYIMETEVTNQQYVQYLNAEKLTPDEVAQYVGIRGYSTRPTEIVYTGSRYRASLGYEDHPVSTTNFTGALSYCQWIDARLPTEFEWEVAARGGSENNDYPWGNDADPTQANVEKRWKTGGRMPTTSVKTYPANKFGLYDLIGNVAEWTSSHYSGYPGSSNTIFQSDDKLRLVVRGGDWYSTWNEARVSFRRNVKPQNRGLFEGALGFRCLLEQP